MSIVKKSASAAFFENNQIAKIQVLLNKNLGRNFEGHCEILKMRSTQKEFKPSWDLESNVALRKTIMDAMFANLVQSHQPQPGEYCVLPLFHGTREEVMMNIARGGFAALATTDDGFFGRGVYFTSSVEYAVNVYSPKNRLVLLSWVAMGNVFPVIYDDMAKLVGKSHYKNYDTHYVLVASDNPSNPMNTIFKAVKDVRFFLSTFFFFFVNFFLCYW
jgi:hypothetical protein